MYAGCDEYLQLSIALRGEGRKQSLHILRSHLLAKAPNGTRKHEVTNTDAAMEASYSTPPQCRTRSESER